MTYAPDDRFRFLRPQVPVVPVVPYRGTWDRDTSRAVLERVNREMFSVGPKPEPPHPTMTAEQYASILGLDAERARWAKMAMERVALDDVTAIDVLREARERLIAPLVVTQILRQGFALRGVAGPLQKAAADPTRRGGAAPGTVHDWGDGPHQKQADGTWKPVAHPKRGKAADDAPGTKASEPAADVAERFRALRVKARAAGIRVSGKLTARHTHAALDELEADIDARIASRTSEGNAPAGGSGKGPAKPAKDDGPSAALDRAREGGDGEPVTVRAGKPRSGGRAIPSRDDEPAEGATPQERRAAPAKPPAEPDAPAAKPTPSTQPIPKPTGEGWRPVGERGGSRRRRRDGTWEYHWPTADAAHQDLTAHVADHARARRDYEKALWRLDHGTLDEKTEARVREEKRDAYGRIADELAHMDGAQQFLTQQSHPITDADAETEIPKEIERQTPREIVDHIETLGDHVAVLERQATTPAERRQAKAARERVREARRDPSPASAHHLFRSLGLHALGLGASLAAIAAGAVFGGGPLLGGLIVASLVSAVADDARRRGGPRG